MEGRGGIAHCFAAFLTILPFSGPLRKGGAGEPAGQASRERGAGDRGGVRPVVRAGPGENAAGRGFVAFGHPGSGHPEGVACHLPPGGPGRAAPGRRGLPAAAGVLFWARCGPAVRCGLLPMCAGPLGAKPGRYSTAFIHFRYDFWGQGRRSILGQVRSGGPVARWARLRPAVRRSGVGLPSRCRCPVQPAAGPAVRRSRCGPAVRRSRCGPAVQVRSGGSERVPGRLSGRVLRAILFWGSGVRGPGHRGAGGHPPPPPGGGGGRRFSHYTHPPPQNFAPILLEMFGNPLNGFPVFPRYGKLGYKVAGFPLIISVYRIEF